MSTWSEAPLRGMVLRGGAAAGARPARMDVDLRDTPFATGVAVDARLTDPHLQQVVELARLEAVEQGRRVGHAEGYGAGRAAAELEAARLAGQHEAARLLAEQQREQQAQQALDVLLTVAEAFRQQEHASVAAVEDSVVDLALALARAVLGRELLTAADPGRDAIARALVLAPEGVPVTVRLHPDDAAALTDVDSVSAGRPVAVVRDSSVERGGCVVEAAGRSIDAQVGPALERAAAVLR